MKPFHLRTADVSARRCMPGPAHRDTPAAPPPGSRPLIPATTRAGIERDAGGAAEG